MGQTRQFCCQSREGIPVGSIPAGSGLRRTRSQRDLTRLNNRTSLGEGWTNVMRAMRAEGFSGYKDLKRVDIQSWQSRMDGCCKDHSDLGHP